MPISSVIKILSIVGPTATGKTDLAISISNLIPAALFSADSRQVYIGMDIVTGKDQPAGVSIAGIDLVTPDLPCSVALWKQHINPELDYAVHLGQLPIFVGGTGLYIKSVLEPITTLGIAPNQQLRKKLSTSTIEELQTYLRRLTPHKYYSLNKSDANNPRRLIRAIEVAEFNKSQLQPSYVDRPASKTTLIIGLRYFDNSLYQSIVKKRVIARIENGALLETKKLLSQFKPNLPSLSALGYKHLIKYLNNELTKQALIDSWTKEELAYAKRQLTWFNKVKGVTWFDASDPLLLPKVAQLVKSWYHKE